jgi:ankyrin repeat protein
MTQKIAGSNGGQTGTMAKQPNNGILDAGIQVRAKLSPQEQERLNNELLKAVGEGDRDKAKRLLNAGADKECRETQGITPLGRATVKNNLVMARMLLEEGANVDGTIWKKEATPLMIACEMDYFELARMFVGAGADVNKRTIYSSSALLKASGSRSDSPELVELLVSKGADVNAQTKHFMRMSETPLLRACLNGHAAKAVALLRAGADRHQKVYASSYSPFFSPDVSVVGVISNPAISMEYMRSYNRLTSDQLAEIQRIMI